MRSGFAINLLFALGLLLLIGGVGIVGWGIYASLHPGELCPPANLHCTLSQPVR